MKEQLTRLHGKRLLVVEEAGFLTGRTRQELVRAGATVLGPLPAGPQTLVYIMSGLVDALIVDLNIEIADVISLIEYSDRVALPFVFATSNVRSAAITGGYCLSPSVMDLAPIAASLFPDREPLN